MGGLFTRDIKNNFQLKLSKHMKKTIQIIINLFFVISLSGCGTMQAIDGSKSHSWNIEVKNSKVPLDLEWRSSPDFEGAITLEHVDGCENYRFFVGSGFFNNKIEQVHTEFIDMKTLPWYPVDQEQKANELLGPCDFLVFQKGLGSEAAVSINIVNSKFETVKEYQLERRESVPLKDWPMLFVAALIDIPVILITTPFVILGAPFWYFSQ
jgi:hypothetical protein